MTFEARGTAGGAAGAFTPAARAGEMASDRLTGGVYLSFSWLLIAFDSFLYSVQTAKRLEKGL